MNVVAACRQSPVAARSPRQHLSTTWVPRLPTYFATTAADAGRFVNERSFSSAIHHPCITTSRRCRALASMTDTRGTGWPGSRGRLTYAVDSVPAPHEPPQAVHDAPEPTAALSLVDAIARRRCVREWTREDVPDAVIARALALARLAPSAGNLQAYAVVVVRDAGQRAALAAAAAHQDFIARAPALLVFLADPGASARKYGARGAHLYAVQDATIACAYAQLLLEAEGVASCWVGAFSETGVARVVAAAPSAHSRTGADGDGDAEYVAATLRPVALLPVGHADPAGRAPHCRSRRDVDEFVHMGRVRAP